MATKKTAAPVAAKPRKLTVGRSYPYTSRAYSGTGKVVEVSEGRTGSWVTLFDKARAKSVTVRPSQVG